MNRTTVLPLALLLAALAVGAGLLFVWTRQAANAAAHPVHAVVPIQDGKTIDFSNGRPAVADGPADKAAMASALTDIDAATRNVTFAPTRPAASTAPASSASSQTSPPSKP